MSNLITSMCDDCKYVKYSFDGGSTKCGYRGKKDCNFIPREKKDLAKYKVRNKKDARDLFADCTEQLKKAKADIERLENQNTLLLKKKCKDINTARKIIKSEAIKEFAKRLKSRLANLSVQTKTHGRKTTPNYVDDIANQILHDVVPQEIDNLVKEMKRGCK